MIRSRPLQVVAFAAAMTSMAAASDAAATETPAGKTTIRSGSHTDFGRIVIDTNRQADFRLDQNGDHVVVRFSNYIAFGDSPALPRNIIAIKTDGPVVALTLKQGTRLNARRLDGHVVLDALDNSDHAAHTTKIRPNARVPEPRQSLRRSLESSAELGGRSIDPSELQPPTVTAPHPPVAAQSLPRPTDAAVPNPASELSQLPLPGRDAMPETEGPVRLLVRRVKLPKDMDGSAFLVPFDSTTSAASFNSGDATYITFSERRPVDMAALRNDPVFGAVSIQLLPGGTLFRMKLPPGRFVALTPLSQGWRIAALTTEPKQQPIPVTYTNGRLNLAAEQPGDVISLADPNTGATLLVGTTRHPGQGVAMSRRNPEFILRPAIQGVVVEPLSDSISLKQVPTGFSLSGGATGLSLSSAASMTDAMIDAAHLTRRLQFPTMPAEAMLRRTNEQIAEAAASPPMKRGLKHRAAAVGLMALGLSAEAQGLLHMAAAEDPKEAASAETGALTAIAALLAGRIDEANALTDPRLDGTDEISMWRAVRQAMRDEGSPAAAAVFAVTAPLALQYPRAIREHILPMMVETMIQGGEIAPAARLLKDLSDDPRLAYARALMRQAEGDTGHALGLLDALATGHDQFDRARAAARAVELRLAAHELDGTQAADALDKQLYAWRGDARELALRERVAELRSQTGAWPVALATLRQAETDFPDQATAIHDRLKDTFAAMIRDRGTMAIPPLKFVSMVDENIDLTADSGDDQSIEQALSDRLFALDLPGRAKPVLEKLLRTAQSDEAKARFGASLATLDVRDGNDAAAQAVLDASEGRDLPSDLSEQRAILRAQSIARLGDPAAGANMLAALRTEKAMEARAQILEGASDWTGAAQAWAQCTALTAANSGVLDETAMRLLLRLATATARAGDDAGLADLRLKFVDRIGAGSQADMFRLLTAEPIRTTGDLGRSQREVNLATSLSAGLKAVPASPLVR